MIDALVALSFGASLISIFARLGGGIFTKGADVGGDMVGKVEAGIPEDDPRNPATIADNVGDNVGDCAGMAADLFETYVVTTVATMVLAAIVLPDAMKLSGMVLPLAIGGACVVTSIIGSYFVQAWRLEQHHGRPVQGLHRHCRPFARSSSIPVMSFVFGGMATDLGGFTPMHLFWCGATGLVVTGLIVWITEYYTGIGRRPVNSIAEASLTGHGTNVIQGLAVSLESTALPALVIIAGIIVVTSTWPASSASPSRLPRCWLWPAWSWRSMRLAPLPITPAASPKWQVWPRTCGTIPMRSTRSATPPRR